MAAMASRQCRQCHAAKLLTEFARQGRWFRHTCKVCMNAYYRALRAKNLEHRRVYDRARQKDQLAARRQTQILWRRKNSTKRDASNTLRHAVFDGLIIKPKRCERCKRKVLRQRDLHGHHDDYSKPLVVRWLCPLCHAANHRKEKSCPQFLAMSVPPRTSKP